MRDKTDLIYEALVEFRNETKVELSEMKRGAKEHAEEMKEHRKDVQKKFDHVEKRLDDVEAPRKALGYLKSWSAWILSVGGAVSIILKIWGN